MKKLLFLSLIFLCAGTATVRAEETQQEEPQCTCHEIPSQEEVEQEFIKIKKTIARVTAQAYEEIDQINDPEKLAKIKCNLEFSVRIKEKECKNIKAIIAYIDKKIQQQNS